MTLADATGMARAEFVKALGWSFENSPWVAERAWEVRPFASTNELHAAMMAVVERAPPEEQLTLLRAHPDLGTRARVSAASAGEQKGAGIDCLSAEDFEVLQEYNRQYREKFGFPFIFAVKGSTTGDIQLALMLRLDSEPEEELHQALWEVGRIAWFRLEDTFQEI